MAAIVMPHWYKDNTGVTPRNEQVRSARRLEEAVSSRSPIGRGKRSRKRRKSK